LALLHSLTFDLNNFNASKNKIRGNRRNVNGVLADEMGLGKTAQTIAFLAWLKYGKCTEQKGCDSDVVIVDDSDDGITTIDDSTEYQKPHLIVVPASVLENWQREFKKFCPTMNIIK
jgi:SNF2 family DNA or RNA helicase